jgi:hypothetical protein
MRKFISLFSILAFSLVLSSAAFAGPNHDASAAVGEAAAQAGSEALLGAKKIAKVFVVVGKTVVDGTAFVILSGAEGVVWIAEETVYGLKYVAKGAKFVIVQTAKGIRWVAVEALKAAEIVLEAALEVTELVIEDVVYVLIKVQEGFVFVAKQAIKAGKVVIRGVVYVAEKTMDGIVFVAEATANFIKKAAGWVADKTIAAKIRVKLASALIAGGVNANTLSDFQTTSVNASASPHLRKLATAAYNACTAFNAQYNQ